MEIFKLFESTLADIQPGHISTKDLRRDQLLNNYAKATNTLETLIKAKENEITYRRNLIEMLEKSKVTYDNKLMQAKQAYQTAKKHAPDNLDLKSSSRKSDLNKSTASSSSSLISTTPPPLPPVSSGSTRTVITTATATGSSPMLSASTPGLQPTPSFNSTDSSSHSQQSSTSKHSDLDIPMPSDINENRSSLDRRLSEFLKTFPNLTQAGMAQPTTNNSNNNNNNNLIKPMPGYYTQQPPISATPPLMAMMRFPPPPLVPPPNAAAVHQHHHHHHANPNSQENHDTADMDLSDYDESTNNIGSSGGATSGILPMIATAMQQGAGGKQRPIPEPASFVAGGQHYNSQPIQYTPRLNPLPFDPSIMEPRLRDSPSSGRDKQQLHGEGRSSHSSGGGSGSSSSGRHSGSGSGSTSSIKHGSDKNSKYSSSSSSSHSSSSRIKRR